MHAHTQPFYGPISWTTRVSQCQKKSSSGLYGARIDIRGRHTDNPAGRHSIRTIQQPTSLIPSFLRQMPFLPQPSKFILAQNMLACIPSGVLGTLSLYVKCSRMLTVADIFTFHVMCSRGGMYIGHGRLCVCLSVHRRIPTLLHGPVCNSREW